MPGSAPTVENATSDQSSTEDAAWSFIVPAGTFADVDGDTLTYAATLANGDTLPAWLSFDDATQTFSGTPPANFNGVLDLTVTASDGTLLASDTFGLTIDPVNDRPVLTAAAPLFTTLTEDATTNTGRTVSSMLAGHATDVDGDVPGVAVTGQSSGNGTWQFSLDNGATWTAFGDLSTDDALLLRSTDRVRFLPNGQNGATAQFSFVAWDRSTGTAGSTETITGGTESPFSAVTDTATITVTSRNDAPVLAPINPTFALINDSGTVIQKTVASLIGASISDVDTGAAAAGIAVTGLQGNGTWEYSHDHGATWTSFGSASDASARLLLASDLVRFTPTSTNGGPASLTYVGWDRTSGVAEGVADVSIRGGTTAFSSAHDVASISGNDLLVGGEGNDTLIGLSGDDTLLGNDGSDTLDGGSGSDSVDGGSGNDSLSGGSQDDTLSGGDGVDSLYGGTGNDSLAQGDFTGDFGDTLSGGGVLYGGVGDDYLFARGNSTSLLDGGSGNDTLESYFGGSLYGGEGDDRIIIPLSSSSAAWDVDGGAGFDIVQLGGNYGPNLPDWSGVRNIEFLTGLLTSITIADATVTAGATLFVAAQDNGGHTQVGGYTFDGSAELDGHLDITGGSVGGGNNQGDDLSGGSLSDTIRGLSGNDTLRGNGGDDNLDGGTGFDRAVFSGDRSDYTITEDNVNGQLIVTDLRGIDGADTLVGVNQLQFADQTVDVAIPGILLIGTDAADTLTGGEGTDSLSGEGGDDTLLGNDGSDTLDGGSGFDTMRYTSAVTGITVDLAATTATGNEIGADRLFGIEGIIGGQAGDSISGNAQANWIDGYTGIDTLITSVTNLVLAANVENLVLAGVAVKGTGNAADNQVTGNAVANALFGADGNDTLSGDLGKDTLDGGVGNDSLNGGDGADVLKGGLGNDRYVVDVVGDVVTEALDAGTDTVATTLASYTLGTNVENLTGIGGVAASLNGNGLTNFITGTAFNDSLDGGAGADTLKGGLGDDSYTVDVAGDVVTEGGNAGTDTVRTALATFTLGSNVENLLELGTAASALTGNGLANMIIGNAGNDSLDGGGGNDTLKGGSGDDSYTVNTVGDVVTETGNGGADTVLTTLANYTLGANVEALSALKTAAFTGIGNGLANTITGNAGNDSLDGAVGRDTMIGGLGNDTYTVDNSGDLVTEASNAGTDTVRTSLSSFTLGANLENLIALGTAAFTGTGNGLANAMSGGVGDDSLDGRAGSDTMAGGLGNDTYAVDSLTDIVTEAAGGGVDTVTVKLTNFTLGSNLEALVGLSSKASTLIGNGLANTITGNVGNDSLDGAAGRDTMAGGMGNDTYTVDAQGELVTEAAGGGTDTVRSTLTNYTLGAEIEKLVALGTGNFNGTGNSLANSITGNIGNDRINGMDGNDTMTGGLGDDVFVFNTVLSLTNRDTITDFNTGNDTIRLENTGTGLFNALLTGALAASAFKLIGPGGSAVDADDRILYKQSTGQLFYDADGSGAGTAILFATLTGTPVIDQTDFLVS